MFQIGCDFLVCLDVCRERIRCKRRTEARTSLVEPKNLWFKKKTWNFVVPDLESSIYLIALLINLFMNQLIFFQFFALEKKRQTSAAYPEFLCNATSWPGPPTQSRLSTYIFFGQERTCVCLEDTTLFVWPQSSTCDSEQYTRTDWKLLLFLACLCLVNRNCLPREDRDLLSRRIRVVKRDSEKPLNHPQSLCEGTKWTTIQRRRRHSCEV